MAKLIEAGMKFWPEYESWQELQTNQVIRAYEQGFVGAWKDPEAKEILHDRVRSLGFQTNFAEVATSQRFAGAADGKLVIPFRLVEYVFPGCWPGAAQARGDCVSHDTKNAALLTFACEIAMGRPDEKTGIIEVAPQIPTEGIQQGAFSSESVYWWRGYNGDGWSCDTAAEMVMRHGILVRKNYDKLGVDLTTYSGSKAGLYGSRAPGADIAAEMALHPIRTVADANTIESIADALYKGYGVSSCGGEGYSSSRDANGVSSRSGSWAHAMAIIGVDFRASTLALYGEPLILILNSWGIWNSGSRRIRGTNIDIPNGAFWVRWSQAKNRDYHVLSSANGWTRDKFDPLHLGIAV